MRTLIAALTLCGVTVAGWAQPTNSDIATPPAPRPTNSVAAAIATNSAPPESTAVIARDIRLVSGIRVNLGPIHDFERNPMGDRPLKHWKKINFLTVSQPQFGQSVCRIKVEGGDEITAVINNVPQPIVDAYQNALRLTEEQQRLANQAAANTTQAQQALQAAQNTSDVGANDQNIIRNANNASARLNRTAEDLAKVNQDMTQAQSYFASIAVEYAMFTGKKAKDQEVWDCGIKVK